MAGYMMSGLLWLMSRLVQGLLVSTFVVLLLVPDVLYDFDAAVASYVIVTGIVFFGNLLVLGMGNWFLRKLATACIVAVLTIVFFIPGIEIGIMMFFYEKFWLTLMIVFVIVLVADYAAKMVTGFGDEEEIPVEERGDGMWY